ncbi:MAG: NAD(P)H-dependent oxidoreductase [Marinoscillum sp.]
MKQPYKPLILGICGSTSKNSSSWKLLEFILAEYQDWFDLRLYEGLSSLPHFNPEFTTDNVPAEVVKLREQIGQADGILFCTPEYVFSLPGSLKNLIEWNVSTTLFSAKPVAMIVAAASGAKAFESLDLILTTIESTLPDSSKLLIQGAKGKIRDKAVSDLIATDIMKTLQSLMDTISVRKKTPTKYLNLN